MTAPDRIETGKVQVGDDWPGVFMRGDHALRYAMVLKAHLAGGESAEVNKLIHRAVLDGLADTLASAKAHNGIEPVMLTRATPAPDAAIREAWERAYWRIRSYAVHDNDCKLNKPPRFDGPCSCGLTNALEEALALLTEKPHDRA